jgi:hypothetical protein
MEDHRRSPTIKVKEKKLLEDFGNMVSINGQKIPAVNIQVEDMPGYIYHQDWGAEWYGVYFEILFEPGYLWVVSQGADEMAHDMRVMVTVYGDWARDRGSHRHIPPDVVIPCAHWDDFLEMYNSHRKDSRPGALV